MPKRKVVKIDPVTRQVVAIYENTKEAGEKNFCSFMSILRACNRVNKKRPGIAPDGYRYEWGMTPE